MILSPAHLFQAAGIECWHIARDPLSEEIRKLRSKAVFVIDETAEACRVLEAASVDGAEKLHRQKFRFGDIVFARQLEDGTVERGIVPNGQDAALIIEVPDGAGTRAVPFTGDHLLSARETLLSLQSRGASLDGNAQRVLASVSGLFEMVNGNPDSTRFSQNLIGMACKALVADQVPGIRFCLDDAQFARLCTANALRARIGEIELHNPDALAFRSSHEEVIQGYGVDLDFRSGSAHRSPMRDAMRGLMAGHDREMAAIFGSLTATPVPTMKVSAVGLEDFQLLCERVDTSRLSGPWVDLACQRFEDTLAGSEASHFVAVLATAEGRDILLISGDPDRDATIGYVCSWPTVERSLATDYRGRILANFSPEEAPDPEDVERLRSVLAELITEVMPNEWIRG